MTFTAEQYSQMAKSYDAAAADPFVAAERKAEFARKAEWFRFLAEREQAKRSSGEEAIRGGASVRAQDEDPGAPIIEQPRRGARPLVPALWAAGAVLYLFSTLMLLGAVTPFEYKAGQTSAEEKTIPLSAPRQVAKAEPSTAAEPPPHRSKPAGERRHAIAPSEPTYEAPELTAPTAPEQEEPQTTASSPPPSAPPTESAGLVQLAELMKVTKNAIIRNGPSRKAKKIGTATPGAELHVKAREGNWVQFLDPSSGNLGWIHSTLVASSSGGIAERDTQAQASRPTQIESAKKPTNPKQTASAKASKQRSRPARSLPAASTETDLPYDEEFLPRRRGGPGFLARRRMLREGLLSPGFLPPH